MAALWAWIVRLMGGFNIFGGKEPGERLGKIIYTSIICLILIAGVSFTFWKVFLEKKIKNIETYSDCNVTNNHDCSVPVQEAIEKYKYKPIIDLKLWKIIRVGLGG
jgi:hypothetical protein